MTNKSIQIAHIKFPKTIHKVKFIGLLKFICKLSRSVLTGHSETSKLKASHIINSLFEHQNQSLLWDTYKV